MKTIMKALLASALLLPFVAQASEGECDYELGLVRTAINSEDAVWVSGKRPGQGEVNKSNLNTKLDAAWANVTLDKYEGAIDKLLDISEKVTAWADPDNEKKKKLDDATATAVNETVGDACLCVADVATIVK